MNRAKLEEMLSAARLDDLKSITKVGNMLHKKEEDENKKKSVCMALCIIAGVAIFAAVAFAIYKYLSRDTMDDFDDFDDFDDDFDDEFEEDFEDETEEVIHSMKKKAEAVKDTVMDTAEDVKDSVMDVAEDVKDAAKDKMEDVKDAMNK